MLRVRTFVAFLAVVATPYPWPGGVPPPTAWPMTPPPMPVPAPTPQRSREIRGVFTFDAAPGGVTTVEGYNISYSGEYAPFEVDASKVHVDRAGLDGRTERRDVGTISPARLSSWCCMAGVGVNGVQHVDVPRRMLREGMQLLVLRFDPRVATRRGVPQPFRAGTPSGGTGFVRVYLPARAPDPERFQRFIGTDVSPYGTVTLQCSVPPPFSLTYETKPFARLRVAGVRRELGTAALVSSGSPAALAWLDYKALDPLRVDIDPSTHPPLGAPVESMYGLPPYPDAPVLATIKRNGCADLHLHVADGWDLERTITTQAPPSEAATVRPGMTRAEVAYILGYPPGTATKTELDRRSAWTYERGPRQYWSTARFSNDRVSSYEHPPNYP